MTATHRTDASVWPQVAQRWSRAARSIAALVRVAIVAILVGGASAQADDLPRVAHVARALDAVRALGPEARERLDRAMYTAARARCRADTTTPAASCLVEAARAACAGDADRARCEAAADVIAANLRATSAFVDEATRIRLVRGSADYRVALAAELRRRFASLAVELVLAGDAPDLAVAIDALCARRDREIHACEAGDRACVPSVPWSRCVAALVWFVGGST